MKKRIFSMLLVLCMLLSLVPAATAANSVPATRYTYNPTVVNIKVGESLQIEYTLVPEGSTGTVKFLPYDESIATVTEDGLVTGVKAGKTKVTGVMRSQGLNIPLEVNVTNVVPTGISLALSDTVLTVGKAVMLTTTLTPAGSAGTVSYSISDKTVAAVSSGGMITPLKAGSATVTAKVGNASATIDITVAAATPTEVGPGAIADGWYNLSCMGNNVDLAVGGGGQLLSSDTPPAYRLTHMGGETYTLNAAGGKYLGISDPVKDGVQLKAMSSEYRWSIKADTGSGVYSLRPVNAPSMVLNAKGNSAADGTALILWTSSKTDAPANAEFTFTATQAPANPVTPPPTTTTTPKGALDGLYRIQMQSGKVGLLIGGNAPTTSQEAGAKLMTGQVLYGSRAYFEIKPVGDRYTLRVLDTGMMLTAKQNGWAITQQPEDGSESQLFYLDKDKYGSYSIRWNDGLVFDVSGAKAEFGKDILLWKNTGAENQKFLIVPAQVRVEREDLPQVVLDAKNSDTYVISKFPAKRVYEAGEPMDFTDIEAYFIPDTRVSYAMKLSSEEFQMTVNDKRIYKGTSYSTPGIYKANITGSAGPNFIFTVVPKGEKTVTATPSTAKLMVNGKEVALDAYTIGQSTYFKMRDIAMAISGTARGFEVSFDGVRNAMYFTPGAAYTPAGGEMKTGSAQTTTATVSATTAYVGKEVYPVKSYVIGSNNYVGLRDLARTVDFALSWDGANACISLDSTKRYLAGEKNENTRNPGMTIVRGLRPGVTPVSELERLYGKPDMVIADMYEFENDRFDYVPQNYFYKLDWKTMLVVFVYNNKVSAVYTNLNLQFPVQPAPLGGYTAKVKQYKDEKNSNNIYATLTYGNADEFGVVMGIPMISDDNGAFEMMFYYALNGYLANQGWRTLSYDQSAFNYAKEIANKNFDSGKLTVPGKNFYVSITGMGFGFEYFDSYLNVEKGFRDALKSGWAKAIGVGYCGLLETSDAESNTERTVGNMVVELK